MFVPVFVVTSELCILQGCNIDINKINVYGLQAWLKTMVIFFFDNVLEEVTVNVNTTTDDHAYTSSRSMPTTSNAMVNDSNLGTKQADVISSGSTSLNLKLVRKSNSTSDIWTYFGFNADKHGNPIDD